MRLEAVTCCVNYADFLAETLPHNRHLFDHLVVVTAPEDVETQRVCEYWHVEVLLTDAFRSRWGEFCKGCGINEGLAALKLDDWVLHLDADIMLPPLTRQLLEAAELDPSVLYGADRHVIPSIQQWREHMALPRLQQENGMYVHVDAYRMGTRFAAEQHGGYLPIGFFQLWNPKVSGVTVYPQQHNGAGRTDMLFALNWRRGKRALLPEVVAYHLESELVPQGTNWDGRATARFGVAPHPDAVASASTPRHRKEHHHHRHHHHHHHPHYE